MGKGFFTLLAFIVVVQCTSTLPFSTSVDNVTEQSIEINGTSIFTKTCGQGEALIIVHGGPGLDHSYLLPQMFGLSDYYTLIFYDQRASGRSAADGELSVEVLVEDIESIRKHYGLDRFHLMGHSWGGYLAMKYALKYQKHLNSLILMNSMAPSDSLRKLELASSDSLEIQYYQPEIDAIMSSEDFQRHSATAYEKLFRTLFKKEFYDPQRADELTLNFPETFYDNSQKLQAMAPELESYDIIPELPKLSIPCLIFYGVDEPAADLLGPILWENIGGSELVIIPRCGHFPFIEQPTRLFEKITTFTKYL